MSRQQHVPRHATHVRILAGRLDRGAGSHVYHYQLARHLAMRGYEVSVMAFYSEHAPLSEVEIHSVRIPNFSNLPVVWRYASALRHWYCGREMRTSQAGVPDVVIGGEHLWLKGSRRRFPDIPWIYLPHSLTVRDEIDSSGLEGAQRDATLKVYQRIQSWALSTADCILRFTKSGCRSLKSEYPDLAFSRLIVNEIGIDVPEVVTRSESSGPLRLLIVGRLIFSKGIDLALDSLAHLKEYPWVLTIVGAGAEREALERQVRRLGLDDRVVFAGSTECPDEWYLQSDLLLFPSRSESLGLVALEAMGHGTPCLAFKPNGTEFRTVSDEFITHGHTGLLANSTEEFTDILRRVLFERRRLLELGRMARQEVLRRYSWEVHLSRYERIFEWLRLPPPRRTLTI